MRNTCKIHEKYTQNTRFEHAKYTQNTQFKHANTCRIHAKYIEITQVEHEKYMQNTRQIHEQYMACTSYSHGAFVVVAGKSSPYCSIRSGLLQRERKIACLPSGPVPRTPSTAFQGPDKPKICYKRSRAKPTRLPPGPKTYRFMNLRNLSSVL